MMIKRAFLTFVFLSSTTLALAHQGVKNPAVKARMDSMVTIKTAMKTLDDMAKGRVPFAKEKARKAAFSIEYQAVLTPDLFREAASDPKSEARPEIWERFEDFVQKSEQMKAAAQHAAQNINDIASIRASLVKMGKTCKACHSDYRQK